MGIEKENYFSPENIQDLEQKWITILGKIRPSPPSYDFTDGTALLVLDMQNVFLSPQSHAYIPASEAIIPRIQQLIQAFEHRNRPIIFTKHLSSKNSQDSMARWWRRPIAEDAPTSEIHPDFDPTSHPVIKKSQYSAFFQTGLQAALQKLNVKTLVITGVMTHLCCETTARDGFMHGYEIYFPMDATATYTEHLHLGTLRAITHGFGRCPPTKIIVENLEKE